MISLHHSIALLVLAFSCRTVSVQGRSPQENWGNNNRSNYATYSIAPFAINFRTTVDLDHMGSDLSSTLASPLRLVTGEFLLESFRIQMAKTDIRESSVSDMIRSLQTLEMQVMVHEPTDMGSDLDEKGRERRHRQMGVSTVQLLVEFHTAVAFIKPLDDSKLPSNQEVSELLGSWIELAFQDDTNYYLENLRLSSYAALQRIETLEVVTRWDPSTVPFPASSAAQFGRQKYDRSFWTRISHGTLILFLVIFMLFTVGLLVLAVRRVQQGKKIHRADIEKLEFDTELNAIAGRHGDEILNVLEASDRWLSQNRPDLFDAINSDDSISGSPRPSRAKFTGRFQQVVSKIFTRKSLSPADEDVDQHIERTGSELADDSICSSWTTSVTGGCFGNPPEGEGQGGRLFNTWFHRSRSFLSRDDTHSVTGPLDHPSPTFDDSLACDEDPGQYSFAFQDFPRHDGTPCLIYSSADDSFPLQTEIDHLSGDIDFNQDSSQYRYSSHPLCMDPSHQVLSDEEFQLALVQHDDVDQSLIRDESQHQNSQGEVGGEFLGKLERLIAMRHRHYEKEAIVEKHRIARRREREEQKLKNQQEVQERDRLLQRHSLELEIQQLEANASLSMKVPQPSQTITSSSEGPKMAAGSRHRSVRSVPDIMSLEQPEFMAQQQMDNLRVHAKIPPKAPTLKPSPTSVMDAHMLQSNQNNMPPKAAPTNQSLRKPTQLRRHRRSFSFSNLEEKKMGDSMNPGIDRTGSHSEDVLLHGIYAQFV